MEGTGYLGRYYNSVSSTRDMNGVGYEKYKNGIGERDTILEMCRYNKFMSRVSSEIHA